jgi:hypothetical protein
MSTCFSCSPHSWTVHDDLCPQSGQGLCPLRTPKTFVKKVLSKKHYCLPRRWTVHDVHVHHRVPVFRNGREAKEKKNCCQLTLMTTTKSKPRDVAHPQEKPTGNASTPIGQRNVSEARIPDFSNRQYGIAAWSNLDKNQRTYLTIHIPLLGVRCNLFSTDQPE